MTPLQMPDTATARTLSQSMLNANQSSTSTSGTANPSTSSTANASAPNVTSADFLTLLVSELKNQDPTQPTDPTAYVQQLVGVNSLQQLIQINQDLSGGTTGSTTSSSTGV